VVAPCNRPRLRFIELLIRRILTVNLVVGFIFLLSVLGAIRLPVNRRFIASTAGTVFGIGFRNFSVPLRIGYSALGTVGRARGRQRTPRLIRGVGTWRNSPLAYSHVSGLSSTLRYFVAAFNPLFGKKPHFLSRASPVNRLH
jgi:hypothetical protein